MAFSDKWKFIRTCQSCGHEQEGKDPALWKSDKWRDVKCKSCGNDDLDYGSKRPTTPEEIAEYEAWEAKEAEEYDKSQASPTKV